MQISKPFELQICPDLHKSNTEKVTIHRSRTPPRPPSRTDSLNPTSKSKVGLPRSYKFTKGKLFHKKPQGRPQSVVTRSPLPPLLAGRPLSVPGFGDDGEVWSCNRK